MTEAQYNRLVGSRIRAARKEKNMTLKELGNLVGLSESTTQRYERGQIKSIDINIAKKFADALHVPAETLLGWERPISNISSPNVPSAAEELPPLTPRDERQIARDLEKMLADLDDKNDLAAVGGTVEDAEDRELLRASLLTSMRLAKQIAKKKFTPKKYRKDENK